MTPAPTVPGRSLQQRTTTAIMEVALLTVRQKALEDVGQDLQQRMELVTAKLAIAIVAKDELERDLATTQAASAAEDTE